VSVVAVTAIETASSMMVNGLTPQHSPQQRCSKTQQSSYTIDDFFLIPTG